MLTSARRRNATPYRWGWLRPLGREEAACSKNRLLDKGHKKEGTCEGRGVVRQSCPRQSLGQARAPTDRGPGGRGRAGPHFLSLPLVVRCEPCRGPERLALSWTPSPTALKAQPNTCPSGAFALPCGTTWWQHGVSSGTLGKGKDTECGRTGVLIG